MRSCAIARRIRTGSWSGQWKQAAQSLLSLHQPKAPHKGAIHLHNLSREKLRAAEKHSNWDSAPALSVSPLVFPLVFPPLRHSIFCQNLNWTSALLIQTSAGFPANNTKARKRHQISLNPSPGHSIALWRHNDQAYLIRTSKVKIKKSPEVCLSNGWEGGTSSSIMVTSGPNSYWNTEHYKDLFFTTSPTVFTVEH